MSGLGGELQPGMNRWPLRFRVSKTILYSLFAGLLVSIPSQVILAQPVSANLLGTVYEAPNMAFGGGNGPYPSNCAAGQVVVGVTFNQSPMVWGYSCAPLNANGTISPLSASLRSTSGYVFCPDGTAAIGMRIINSGGYRLGLVCKTPPGFSDAEFVTQFVRTQGSPIFLTRTTEAIAMQSMCNTGDVMMGTTTWQNLWFDQLRSRCAPFLKYTVTYNVNGGTGTVPAIQTQSGPGSSIALSAQGSISRTGFRFGGWNTLTSGAGTTYQPGDSITPTANTVLYAQWESKVTYNANGASSGTVPADTLMKGTAATTSLATNSGNLTLTGYSFGGWNTKADGTGTTYPVPTPATITETPYMHFMASNFDDTSNAWTNNGDTARNIPGTAVTASAGNIRGNPTLVTNVAGSNGANKSFPAVQGGTGDGIVIGNAQLNSYTLCHVARYAGGNRGRIFAGVTGNWLSGFWNGNAGVAHHEGWITSSSGWNDTNWRVQCATGSTTTGNSGLRTNGVDRTTTRANTTPLPANITINLQASRTAPVDASDWAVAEFYIFDSVLSEEKLLHLEAMLNHKYGLTGFTASTLDTFDYASTGDITLYAQWNSTITYNGNGQTSAASTVPAATLIKGVGATTTLANQGSMTRTGYTFAGWNTQADGGGTDYPVGTTYTTSGNATLYAKWTRTVTYNVNGATSGTPERATDVFVNAQTVSIATLPTVGTMVRQGYTFAGWSTTTTGAALTTPYIPSTNTTLYARWTANTYEVTYLSTNSTSGGPMANTSFTAGTAFSLRANTLVRLGYSFGGWNTQSDGTGTSYTNSQSVTLYANLTLHPKWTLLKPGVPVVTASAGNGQVSITPLSPAASSTVGDATSYLVEVMTTSNLPAFSPTRTCTVTVPATSCTISGLTNGTTYRFKVTARNAAGTAEGWSSNTTPFGALINFNATTNSGALVSGASSVTFNQGTPAVLPNATRANYTFAGWYSAASGGTLIGGSGSSFAPSSTFTISNKSLSSNVATLTTTTPHGLAVGTSVIVSGVDATFDGTYTITAIPSTTTFSYAKTATNVATTAVSPNGFANISSMTLFAQYVGNTYTITYNGNGHTGGTVPSTGTFQVGGSAHIIQGATNPPTRSGYTFAGWVASGAVSGPPTYYPSGPQLNVALTSVLSGDWTLCYSGLYSQFLNISTLTNSCTGTYLILAAGEIKTANVSSSMKADTAYILAAGERSTVLSTTTRNTTNLNNGTYWYNTTDISIGFDDDSSISQNQCFQDSRSLCWHLVANTGGYSAHDQIPGNSNTGWVRHVYQSSGLKSQWAVGDSYQYNSNVTLLARWTPNTNTIIYNSNGASSGSVPANGTHVTASTPLTVAANTGNLVKTGSTFTGWNTAADGTGTSYLANGSTTLTTTQDLTLYAQWRANTYSYTYQLNGGTSTVPVSGTVLHGETITVTSTPVRDGFTFAGWNDGTANRNAGSVISVTSNLVLVAQWTAQSFPINYLPNYSGATETMSAGSYVSGGVPHVIANSGFSRSGYRFDNWNTQADGTGTTFVSGAGYSTSANLTLYAQWTAQSYTITYNGNAATGGTVPETATITTGIMFLASSNTGALSRTGYAFDGWYTNASGTGGTAYAVGAAITTTQNLTLFAKWNIISPTITFNAGEVAIGKPSGLRIDNPTSAQYGSLYQLPNPDTSTVTVESNQYAFAGWETGGVTYKAGDNYRMGASNLIFTAQWIPMFTVKYVLNGGSGSVPADTLKLSGETITVTSVVPTRTGYNFAGWKDQSGNTIPTGEGAWTITATSFIAYAQWTPVLVNINFNLGGGVGSVAPITGKATNELVALPINTSTKTGYTFTGWRINPLYPEGATYVVGTQDATFTAEWAGNTYTITYNGNGATGGTVPNSGTYTSGGSDYVVSSNSGNLAKSGFTFAGWNTNADGTSGANYTGSGSETLNTTSNLTLYAKWSAASYAVSYNTNGGGTNPTQTDVQFGSSFTLAAAPTRSGYNFLGWEVGSGATATLYGAGTSYTMGSSAVSFTAKWSGQSYLIAYSLNGGSGTAPASVEVSHDGNFTTAAAPTRDGFNFTKWSDGTTLYDAGASITNVTSNKTLTAQWTIAAPGVPGVPTAVPGNGSAIVTITPPTSGGAPSSYTITASNGATCTVLSPATSCTISPLTNGTAYTFTAMASNTAGDSSTSSNSNSVVPAGLPAAPPSVTGSGTAGTVNLEWSLPESDGGSSITDYVIEYSEASSGNWITFSDGISTTRTATVTGLSQGKSYEFRVTTKNIIGNSLPSLASPVVNTLPGAPVIGSAVAGNETATVTWNSPTHLGSSSITGYTVTAYDPTGQSAGQCTTTGATSCIVENLDNGTAYTFKVVATTDVGDSVASSSSNSATPATKPSAPTGVTAQVTASGITVSFTAPTDNGGASITSYTAIPSDPALTCIQVGTTLSFNCTGGTPGTNYSFQVKATNRVGDSADSLASEAVTALGVPGAPRSLAAEITASANSLSAKVSFAPPASDGGTPVTSYTVTASPGGATCTVNATETFCEITGLIDRAYTFTARATNSMGTSIASSATASTLAANGQKPLLDSGTDSAPTGTVKSGSTLTANATYTALPSGVVSYVWQRCETEDPVSCEVISGATSSTYLLTASDVGKHIRVQTSAQNSIGSSTTDQSLPTAVIEAATAPTPQPNSAPNPAPNPEPNPAPNPAPEQSVCDAACAAEQRAAADKAAADKAAADKAAAEKAAADKFAAEQAAKRADENKQAQEANTAASKKAEEAKAAAEKFIDRIAEAAAAQLKLAEAAALAAEKEKVAKEAKAAADKAAAEAKQTIDSKNATAAEKAAAAAAAKKATDAAKKEIAAAAKAAKEAAAAKEATKSTNKALDIAINSLTSKTASAQATAQANRIAAAAKSAATKAANVAAERATKAQADAKSAEEAARRAADELVAVQEKSLKTAEDIKLAAQQLKDENDRFTKVNQDLNKALNELAEKYKAQAENAKKLSGTEDAALRDQLNKAIELTNNEIALLEKSVSEKQSELEAAQASVKAIEAKVSTLKESAAKLEGETAKAKTELTTKTAAAKAQAATAQIAAKTAAVAKAAAAALPNKAVIQAKPTKSGSKNSATATITGLKPGQKVRVTVKIGGKP